MKKVLIATALVLVVAVPAFAGQYAGLPTAKVVVNGKELNPDVPPVILDGRTMLPVRAVAEALKCDVEWDDATKTAKITDPFYIDRAEYKRRHGAAISWLAGAAEAVGKKDKETIAKELERAGYLVAGYMMFKVPEEVLDLHTKLCAAMLLETEAMRYVAEGRDDPQYFAALLRVERELIKQVGVLPKNYYTPSLIPEEPG